MLTTELVLGVGLPLLGGIVWLIRLEGRVNTQDAKHENLEKSQDEVKDDVKYVRGRVDEIANVLIRGQHGKGPH